MAQVPKAGVQSINRFKTGGIVVTAVQQSSTKKVKKHHRSNKSQHSLMGGGAGCAPKKEQNNSSGGGILPSKTNLSMNSSLSSSTFARKVKTKLAKKKSHHSRDEPCIIIPCNRKLVNTNGMIVANNSIYGMPLSRKT